MCEFCKQVTDEISKPIPCTPGQSVHIDDRYVRNGVVEIFTEVEPLAGKRHAAVIEHRTRRDWGIQIKRMFAERYARATRVCLAMDNLNTHTVNSLYKTFKPTETRRGNMT